MMPDACEMGIKKKLRWYKNYGSTQIRGIRRN
jgi:hypothetical protein